MSLYEDQFLEKNDLNRVEKPSKTLIIASTGRSGSHMLGHALQQTGCFGFPLEYTNPQNLAEWKRRLKIDDLFSVLTEIQQRRTSSNGIFGIKIHHSHIKQFGSLQDIINFFPNACFVLLSREDVLKQAISMSIAKQTGVWISGQTAKNTNPQYNFKHINSCLKQIIIDNSTWRYLLSASGCDYIEMNFNSVQNDLAKAIVDIANFVNIDINIDDIPKKQITKKQSNNINAEWAIKFISDFDTTNKLISEPELSYFERLKNRVKKI